MIQVSLVGYWVGGTFLALEYWDYPYLLMALLVLTQWSSGAKARRRPRRCRQRRVSRGPPAESSAVSVETANSKRRCFEARWRERFREFAELHDDDAGIAGWRGQGSPHVFGGSPGSRGRAAPRGRWLDAGCGAGTYTRLLHESGHEVVGVDYLLLTVQKAWSRDHCGAQYIVGDVNALPFAGSQFRRRAVLRRLAGAGGKRTCASGTRAYRASGRRAVDRRIERPLPCSCGGAPEAQDHRPADSPALRGAVARAQVDRSSGLR